MVDFPFTLQLLRDKSESLRVWVYNVLVGV